MLFYAKENGQGLTEFVVVLLVLGVIFYAVMKTVAPDKLHEIISKISF